MTTNSITEKGAVSHLKSDKGQNSVAVLVLLTFFVFSAFSVHGRDLTTDEPSHYRYGVNILNGDSTRFDDSKMPVSALNALPAKLSGLFPDGLIRTYLSKYLTARLMTTLFSAVTSFVIFVWSRKLYGFVPALFSLGLYVLDPNIIAHSQLITTDAYVMGMILVSSYWLWKFAENRTWKNGLILSVILGMTQLTKYTAISLYPVYMAALVVHDWNLLRGVFASGGWLGLGRQGLRYLKYALVAALTGILIINAGFLFNRTFTNLSDYQFRSSLFQNIQSRVSFVVPVPYPYLEGLDWVMHRERTGEGYGRIYLLGYLREGGFLGYFLIASLFKEPITTQLFVTAALLVFFLNPGRRQTFLRNEIFLLLPALFYAVYFNFFYNTQIGIRYYLVLFPLLFVFTGGLFTGWEKLDLRWRALLLGMVVYLAGSVLSYYPYYLPYFNELVWDKAQAYKILADSNLDWEQSVGEVEKYFAEHPEAEFPTAVPKRGHYVISVNRLVGVIGNPTRFAWLREVFEPAGTVAYSHLVYNISENDIIRLCRTTNYCD